jgi:hypothetical protein
MAVFVPGFDVGAQGVRTKTSAEPRKPPLDAFGVGEALAWYTPLFSTKVRRHKLVMPKPVHDIRKKAAAPIFTHVCEKQIGFGPDFKHN